MKKHLLLFLPLSSVIRQFVVLLFVTVSASTVAQSFELTMNSKSFSFDGDTDFIACDGHIKNVSPHSADSMITWERTMDIPATWNVSVCDIMNCWFPLMTSSTFKMKQGQEGLFDINVYPQGQEGSGSVTILMYFANKKSEAKTYVFDVEAKVVSALDNVQATPYQVQPNPFTNTINIKRNTVGENGCTYSIVTITGLKVKSDLLNADTQIDLSTLRPGGYILSIYHDKKMKHTQLIMKKD